MFIQICVLQFCFSHVCSPFGSNSHKLVFLDCFGNSKQGLGFEDNLRLTWFEQFFIHIFGEKKIKVLREIFWRMLTKFTCNKFSGLMTFFNDESDLQNEMKHNNFLDVFKETRIRTKRLLKQEKWSLFCFLVRKFKKILQN